MYQILSLRKKSSLLTEGRGAYYQISLVLSVDIIALKHQCCLHIAKLEDNGELYTLNVWQKIQRHSTMCSNSMKGITRRPLLSTRSILRSRRFIQNLGIRRKKNQSSLAWMSRKTRDRSHSLMTLNLSKNYFQSLEHSNSTLTLRYCNPSRRARLRNTS